MPIQVITDPTRVARPLRPDSFVSVGNPIYYGLESDRYEQVPPIANVWDITFNSPPNAGEYVSIYGYAFFFQSGTDVFNPFQVDRDAPNANAQLAIKLATAINSNSNTTPFFTAVANFPVLGNVRVTANINIAALNVNSNAGAALTLTAVNAPGPAIYRQNYRLNVDVFINPDYLYKLPLRQLRRLSIPAQAPVSGSFSEFIFELQNIIKPELEFDVQTLNIEVVTFANRCIREATIKFFESFGLNTTSGTYFTDLVSGFPWRFKVLNSVRDLLSSLLHTTTAGNCTDSILDFDNILNPYFDGAAHKFLTDATRRLTYIGAPEYLCWYYPTGVTDNLRLVAEVTYLDGTKGTFVSSPDLFADYICCDPVIVQPAPLPSDRIMVVPVHRLWREFDFTDVREFSVHITDNVLFKYYTNIITYELDHFCRVWTSFHFSNSFGVPDTFHIPYTPDTIRNTDRTESRSSMDRTEVYRSQTRERNNYENRVSLTRKYSRQLRDYERTLTSEFESTTNLYRVSNAKGGCCVVTDGCRDASYRGATSARFVAQLGNNCGKVIVAYFPNANFFDPATWDWFTLFYEGGIVADTGAPTFFPGVLSFDYPADPAADDFFTVAVTAGGSPINTYSFNIHCPGNFSSCGAGRGVLPVGQGTSKVFYTGVTPGTVTLTINLSVATAVFLYWNGTLAAIGSGTSLVLSFPYTWTSGDDDYVVMIFGNVSVPQESVKFDYVFDCPAYAVKPLAPCGNTVLTPCVITDKSYTECKEGNEPIFIDVTIEDGRQTIVNNR